MAATKRAYRSLGYEVPPDRKPGGAQNAERDVRPTDAEAKGEQKRILVSKIAFVTSLEKPHRWQDLGKVTYSRSLTFQQMRMLPRQDS